MQDCREHFKLHNQKRKEYLNQKSTKKVSQIKKNEQQEGGEIRKVLNKCKECDTTIYWLRKIK